jgi:hypothetical protein
VKDSDVQPSRNDIAGGEVNRTEISLFPDHEKWYVVAIEEGGPQPFTGFILEYAYGTGDKRGKYGVIYEFSEPTRFATIDEWFE